MTTLRLKEDPRDWRTFSLSLAGALGLLSTVLGWRRGWGPVSWSLLGAALTLAVLALLVPGRMRPLYRIGMRIGHGLGRIVGGILLGVAFLLVVVPLGLLLRLSGRDLLRLRRNPAAASYWEPARRSGPLDRMF